MQKKTEIEFLINNIKLGKNIEHSIESLKIHNAVKNFVQYSFQIITTKKIHKIASAFTYGREDIIPDMFIAIINEVDPQNTKYPKLKYYFDRHIEIDGDLHGPLSHKMLIELCGDDQKKWDEVYIVGKTLGKQGEIVGCNFGSNYKKNSTANRQGSLVNI